MTHKQKLKKALQELDVLKEKVQGLIDPKLEIGKWYRCTDNSLLFFSRISDFRDDSCGYGFLSNGDWVDERDGYSFIQSPHLWTEATSKEVAQALIEEAKRRGFSIGCKVKAEWINTTREDGIIKDSDFAFEGDTLLFLNHCLIFNYGQWADVINSEKSCPLNEAIQSLKDKHPEYNFTIIAEKK